MSTDPLGTGCGSLGSRGAHFGGHYPNLMDKSPRELLAAHPSRAIPHIFCKTGFQYSVHNSRSLDPIMCKVQPSIAFRWIYFRIRLYLHVYLADGFVLWGFPTTVFYDFGFYFICATHLSWICLLFCTAELHLSESLFSGSAWPNG